MVFVFNDPFGQFAFVVHSVIPGLSVLGQPLYRTVFFGRTFLNYLPKEMVEKTEKHIAGKPLQ